MDDGVYGNVSGARVAEWDYEADEPHPDYLAKVDEMYYDAMVGEIIIRMDAEGAESVIDVSIPVKATQDWNEFVDTLPSWETDE